MGVCRPSLIPGWGDQIGREVLFCAMMTATIIPQIPRIPAMTTGTTDFMMSSGLSTPMEQIPTPALALPQAAPRLAKMRAEATPMYPKKQLLSIIAYMIGLMIECQYWILQPQLATQNMAYIKYILNTDGNRIDSIYLSFNQFTPSDIGSSPTPFYSCYNSKMSYQCNHNQILDQYPDQYPEAHNSQSMNSNQIQHQVKSLEEEIELTVFNYENLLQMEKKNSADRSEFLLYLIQSTRTRHSEELEALRIQLQNAVDEKEEARSLENQMDSIGKGVDSIVQEGKRLNIQNQSLQQQLQEQQARERELDQELSSSQLELDQYRQAIDEWERTQIKWNRRRKEMLQMIGDVQKQMKAGRLEAMRKEDKELENEDDKQIDKLLQKCNAVKQFK